VTSPFGKVAVLLGGKSAEREISLKSGAMVLAALKKAGVEAHAFDPRDQGLEALKVQGFARAFIALHGRFGEDGTVQGALEYLGIPYTGSGVMASAIAMDKWRTKLLWQAAGVPTPPYQLMTARTDPAALAEQLGLPLMVKPAREGSSIGMSKVTSVERILPAYELAARHDEVVVAERFIEGVEVTAAILGAEPLPLIRLETPRVFYDYEAKYFADDTRYICPSGLPAATFRPACRHGARRPAESAGSLPVAGLQRLGPRGRDARPRRPSSSARGEHHTGHDRSQPGADGRARAGHFLRAAGGPDSGDRACGITRLS
jgi:D-alanine-D-alanine ligase